MMRFSLRVPVASCPPTMDLQWTPYKEESLMERRRAKTTWKYDPEIGNVGRGETYKYAGQPMIPQIFAEDLIALFNMSQFRRKQAIQCVLKFHEKNNGLPVQSQPANVFKKAIQYLSPYATHPSYGIWRLRYEEVPSDDELENHVVEQTDRARAAGLKADKTLGEGPGVVYVYYYDTYRQFAELQGKDHWPCKVGMTDVDLTDRIYGQATTAYPERPHVALQMNCENARSMEKVLHGILELWNRKIGDAPGDEWFDTSPDEVKSIFAMVSSKHSS